MRLRVVVLSACIVAAVIFCCQSFSVGQTPAEKPPAKTGQQPPPPLFKSTVRRVVIDVVVRDSEGKPVHGLSAKDFSVSEDGKPQRIQTFDVYDFDKPSISLPPDAPPLPSNTFVNIPAAPERGPLYVILYDMVNMEMEDQITARQQVVKFVDSKPAGTRFAVWVNSDELYLVQGFTADKKLLHAALDPQHPVPHVPRSFLLARNYGAGDTLSNMRVLTHIAEFLNGLPGRKNLIWMAGRFPVALYPTNGDPQDLRYDLKREVDGLTRAQVAVYPLNIRGAVVNPEGALMGTTPYGGSHSVDPLPPSGPSGGTAGASGTGGAAGGTVPSATPDRATAAMQTAGNLQVSGSSGSLADDYMVQNDVATATGGRAFLSDNDLTAALDEATENGANYYSLSYAPTNPNYNGSLRNVRITLARPKCKLQYRRSYYADDPNAPLASRKKNSNPDEDPEEQAMVTAHERPLYAGLQHGAPQVHDLIFKVRVHAIGDPAPITDEQLSKLATQPAYFRGKNRKPKIPKDLQVQKFAIYYAVSAGQIRRPADGKLPLEFAAVGFNSEGDALNGVFEIASPENSADPWSEEAKGNGQPGSARSKAVYRAMQELLLPAGATSIRAVVRDLFTDRVGAVEIPLPLTSEPNAASAQPAQGAQTN